MKLFKVGKKDYVVQYSFNGLIALEHKMGKSFMSLFDEDGISLATIRTLVYCGLVEKQSKLSEEAVGNIIQDSINDGMSFQDIAGLFMNELTAGLGMKETKTVEEGTTPNE